MPSKLRGDGRADQAQCSEKSTIGTSPLYPPLFDVLLDLKGVFALAEDLEKVVVGKEIEARELLALVLKVLVQRPLDLLERLVHALEESEVARELAAHKGVRVRRDAGHDRLVVRVYRVEELCLRREHLAQVL